MTGYGRAEQSINGKIYLVEVRSLNGKQYDMRLFLPSLLKPFEIDIRNVLNEGLLRGAIECNISLKSNGSGGSVVINEELLKSYYSPIAEVANKLGLASDNILNTLLKLPDVFTPSNERLSETDWEEFRKILLKAIEDLNKHRKDEGVAMEIDLKSRIANILTQQYIIAELEPMRRIKIKEGLKKILEDNVGKDKYDPNRMEQEIIYYIEKIDISEEQVRLKNHCDYFLTVMAEKEMSKGKKLSFILQEIGREINTTGAKAYDSELQKCVVLMKDELEKAREQVLNVL